MMSANGCFLIFQIPEELWPAVDELEESFFVGIGNRNQLICNFDPAAFNGFYFIDGNHKTLVYPAYQVGGHQLFQLTKPLQAS